MKSVPDFYFQDYKAIIIVDDNPAVWDQESLSRCKILIPNEFVGDIKDLGLKILMEKLI